MKKAKAKSPPARSVKRTIAKKQASAAAMRRIQRKFSDALNERLAKRKRQWNDEDAELRKVMGLAGGARMGELVGRYGTPYRSAEKMAGINARYDSAVTTDDNREHWAMADGLAADAAAHPMIRYTLRNRCRYETANNSYATGVNETIANDFVGTGPRIHIDDERLNEDDREDVERKFASWAKAIRLPQKLRTMRKAKRVDGETFACKITNPNLRHPVKLDIRLVEADQVRFVDISLLLSPSVDGIRFDDYGNPVSYHILRIHPGFWSYATGYVGMPWEYDVWNASLVYHWFRADRPGQHRGIPEMIAALPLYAVLRRYSMATLEAAETAADQAIIVKTQSGALFTDGDGNTIENNPEMVAPFSTIDLHSRMINFLPAGYDMEGFNPTQPTQQYANFKREICAEIGRCECVPMNVVLADSSNSNFASGQLDHKIYFRTREIERSEIEGLMLDDLFREFLREGVRAREGEGDFGKPYLPQSLRAIIDDLSFSWQWDTNEMGDPLKLAAAKSTALKDGGLTIPEYYSLKGQDWQAAFRQQARALGVTVPELQELIRNQMFATRGTEPLDDGEGAGDGTATKAPAPAVKKPGKAAMQRAS